MTSDDRREIALSLAVQLMADLPKPHRDDVFDVAAQMLEWLEEK